MKIATHDGPFHADEVFATAMLKNLFPKADYIRSRKQEVLDTCDIVYDVGGVCDPSKGRFDHHMSDFDIRHPNGIKKSSLGLLWQEYGQDYCGSAELAGLVEERFVMAIDAADNGQELFSLNELDISPITVNTVVKSYYPKYGQPQDFDAAFEKALAFAAEFLNNLVEKYRAQLAAKDSFKAQVEASPDNRYVVLEEALPYGDGPEHYPELLYIVFPTSEGDKYMVRGVPEQTNSFGVRRKLPEAWAGKQGKDFEEVTGVKGADFCHNGLWLAAAKTKDSALKLVELALNNNS